MKEWGRKSNDMIAHEIARFGLDSSSGEIPVPDPLMVAYPMAKLVTDDTVLKTQFRNRSTRSTNPLDSATYSLGFSISFVKLGGCNLQLLYPYQYHSESSLAPSNEPTPAAKQPRKEKMYI